MTMTGPQYDLLDSTKELTELGNLFYVERLLVESNTDGASVTPELTFDGGTTVSFSTFSRTTRGFDEITINRLGPLVSVALTNATFASQAIGFYTIELQIRPVQLGVNLVGIADKVEIPGRSADVSTSIVFDINPFTFPQDARFIEPVPRRLYIDLQTDATGVTPVLVASDGTETTLTTLIQTTRTIADLAILSGKRLKAIRLDGDFSDASNILFDIELDTYVPGTRRLSVG